MCLCLFVTSSEIRKFCTHKKKLLPTIQNGCHYHNLCTKTERTRGRVPKKRKEERKTAKVQYTILLRAVRETHFNHNEQKTQKTFQVCMLYILYAYILDPGSVPGSCGLLDCCALCTSQLHVFKSHATRKTRTVSATNSTHNTALLQSTAPATMRRRHYD